MSDQQEQYPKESIPHKNNIQLQKMLLSEYRKAVIATSEYPSSQEVLFEVNTGQRMKKYESIPTTWYLRELSGIMLLMFQMVLKSKTLRIIGATIKQISLLMLFNSKLIYCNYHIVIIMENNIVWLSTNKITVDRFDQVINSQTENCIAQQITLLDFFVCLYLNYRGPCYMQF